MSFLAAALDLASRGFHVFPLVANSKLPLIEDYPTLATRDPEQIKRWWLDPILGIEQPHNVGISTTRFGDFEALVVVDVDNKGKKNGDEEILKLELEGKDFPETFTQTTPTGGRHLIYRCASPVKQGTDVLGKGLDIRSRGGYVVAAGSCIDGAYYAYTLGPVSVAPQWIVDACGTAPEKQEPAPQAPLSVDEKRAAKRATHYLTKEAPLAVEGENGDQNTYLTACRVKDFGVSETLAFELMAEHWNPQNQPPWSADELKQKVRNAYKYGVDAPGVASPEAQFKPAVEPDVANPGSYLEHMNTEYALIYMEGNHFILHETVDEKGFPRRVYLTEASFKRRFSPYTVQQGKGQARSFAELWLDWKGRREYAGVCFAPEREPRFNYYNLWRGFTAEPLSYNDATDAQRRGFDLFREHLEKNVCRGDKDLTRWLTGYFAHLVQKPFERPLTTLVFRGRKGTGKNSLVDRVGALLGPTHYLVAHNARYLTSNFNGHMDSCLLLVLDEAFWSGDKTAEGQLKGISTAPTILIERKGKEPYQVDNLMRVVVIGNEDWLVPASTDERRYAVFDMGEGHMQNGKFFEEMRVLLDGGGNRVLLHYLQNFNLAGVNVNVAPVTEALTDQKVASLTPFHQWWMDCLTDGRIVGSDFGGDWQVELDKDRFRSAFRRYCKDRQISSRIPDDRALGKLLKTCLPSIVTNQKRREGEETVHVYRLPELEQARQEWQTFIGGECSW